MRHRIPNILIGLALLLVACTTPSPSPTRVPSLTPSLLATGTAAPLPTTQPDVIFQAGAPSIGDPKAPELGNTGYDVEQYTLALSIDPLAETLSGSVTIEAVTTLADLGRLSLDFSGDYAITGPDGTGSARQLPVGR